MTALRLAHALLLTVCLGSGGCASFGPSTSAASPTPADTGWMDRLFRRGSATPTTTPEVAELPNKLRNPTHLSLAYARLMTEAGNLPEAETHYNRVLAEKPENVDAIVGLAKVHLLGGRYELAEQHYHRALRTAPHHPAALHGMGQTYAARRRWDEAAELLNQAVLASPNDGAIRYDLAVALVHTDNVPAAMPHFISTIGDAEAHYNVGLMLHRQGRIKESEQHFRIALTKQPQLEQARYWLDVIQREQQSADRAVSRHAAGQPPGAIHPVSYESEAGAGPTVSPLGYSTGS